MSYHGEAAMGGIMDWLFGGSSQGAQAGAGIKPTRTQGTASQGSKSDIGPIMASMYAGGTQRPASRSIEEEAARARKAAAAAAQRAGAQQGGVQQAPARTYESIAKKRLRRMRDDIDYLLSID